MLYSPDSVLGDAQCRPARQAGAMLGSKAWTTLDSLVLLDQDAVLMTLEAPSGAGSATRDGHASDCSAEAALSASADPGMSFLPTAPSSAARQSGGNELSEQLEGAVHQRGLFVLAWEAVQMHLCVTAGDRSEQLRIVARTSSDALEHTDGDWVSVQPAQGPETLPDWTAHRASVLWLCVRPGVLHTLCESLMRSSHFSRIMS
jgi:hypothetical protein